ncbi:MAG TPA: glycosyltransferase [Chloroflexota bacterium]|nr:glycosyltransferase [Chloroflexota bacterium]
MRLLFLTPQLPYPPDKGTRIRNFGLIKELSRRHEIGVLSFAESGDAEAAAELGRWCRVLGLFEAPRRGHAERAWRTFLDPIPDLARRLASAPFEERLRELLAGDRWDVLQVEALEMAPHWLAQRGYGPPAVLDAHNAEWILQWRAAAIDLRAGRPLGALYSVVQAAKLWRYEGSAVRRAAAVVAVSEPDLRSIRRVGRPRLDAIAPNGVDTDALPFREVEPPGEMLIFTGTMDFRPNVDAVRWFAARVWPRVRSARPSARFRIVGRAPTPAVRALGGRSGVEVTGAVDDAAPHFRDAAVYVAPLRIGGGVRLKLLEAFAHGVPVVSTRLGAEGIEAEPDRHLVLADEPEAMAQAIVALLADRDRRHQLAAAARQLVVERYDWRVIAPTLDRVYEQVARSGPGRGAERGAFARL